MTENKYQGKVYNFWKLLEDQNIEIPIIQRDYAQGREDKKEIRIDFLNALHKSIDGNIPIKLDFIYGSIINGTFQPLDGQQRLTTLFLLYWYTALKEKRLDENAIGVLSKFSYETRTSSREFCHELVNNTIEINPSITKLSELIIDSSWFFLAWKKDPTINAMLRTIDDIHTIFKDVRDIWDQLISEDILIGFYYVELENFGLTDDLYIKMNARGKLLTPFENFKALFQKHIEDNKWDEGKHFSDSFACKVDTKWTDLFWKHRKNERIDDAFIRFISTILMIQTVLEKSEDRLEKIALLQRKPDSVSANSFSKEAYLSLYSYIETYCLIFNENIPIELEFPLWQHAPHGTIFTALIYEGSNASYTQKVLFYAQSEYLKRVSPIEFNRDKFLCWMRVIRNIVSRGDAEKTGKRPTIIRSPETFDGVIKLINEMAVGCEDIHKFLSSESIKSSFAKEQVEEEKLKARLIMKDEANKTVLFETEDTNFCQGRIDFPFYCIGFDKEQDNYDADELSKILMVIKTYLENEITNDLRRGLLTITDGTNNYYDYWWSWSYAVGAHKRCLIDKYRELEYYIYGTKSIDQYRKYLKTLLIELTTKNLKSVIEDFVPPPGMPNWKVRLIKEPELLDVKCKSNYIAIPEDESCCYLLRGIRPRDINSCEKIE